MTISLDRKSGFVTYLIIDGQPYTAGASCECPASHFTLAEAQRITDHAGERTVELTCATHGARQTIAFAQETRQRTYQQSAVFGWVEQRFHNDRRPQWGKTQPSHRATGGVGGGLA